MVPVTITVTVGRKRVPLEQVRDARVVKAMKEAGQNVGAQLSAIVCPEHGKAPWNIRIHFEASGEADLKYESCCDGLASKVRGALG